MKRDATGRRKSGGRGEAGTQASAAAGGGRWCNCWRWRWRREEEAEANTREQSVPTIPDSSSINFATPTAAPLTRCPSPGEGIIRCPLRVAGRGSNDNKKKGFPK